MRDNTSGKWSLLRRWTAGLLALGLITLASTRTVDAIDLPSPSEVGVAVPGYDLDSLCATALLHNPSVAAAKASLASAIAGQQGVENIRIPTCLQPDLPFRRKQACLGVQAAEANVRQAELLTVFGVQYTYVSYLYASEQERLANQTVEDKEGAQNLASITKAVRGLFEKKERDKNEKFVPDLKERDALFLEGILAFAHSRLTEASAGKLRALSALREAIGVGCDVPLPLKHARLLDVKGILDKRQLIDLALANRPDLLAASINVQVSDLEVKAQGSRNSLNVRTFASGADLHANPLPAGRYDQEYRPGVSGPEMPPFLAGKKCDRVARAAALASRAASVSDKARALSILEVEQIFLRHEEAAAKAASLDQAAVKLKVSMEAVQDKDTKKGIEGASQRFKNAIDGEGGKAALDDLLKIGQLYSQVRAQANEARYRQLIALITLERATGAGFCAHLSGAAEVTDGVTPTEVRK